MNAVETIIAVRSAGGSVAFADGALVVDAPPSLPAAVWEALATHKATLVELLSPRVTYAQLAAHEERVAIQAAPPAAVPTFDRPPPARRCRIIADTPWECPDLGRVTFPAGLEGVVVESPDEIEDPLQRLALAWVLKADGAAGKATVPVLIDGRPRVLDRSAIIIEGSSSP